MTDFIIKSHVKVTAFTWDKDIHGLFDYERTDLMKNEFEIHDSTKFYLKGNFLATEKELPSHLKGQPLFYIQKNPENNKFIVNKNSKIQTTENDPLYKVVRGIKSHGTPIGYEIRVDDVIKFGRIKYVVREFSDEKGRLRKLPEVLIDATPPEEIVDTIENDSYTNQKRICRYCLSDNIVDDNIDNTLICLCKCKGSLKYTHVICFRHWIDSKKKDKDKFTKVTQSCISYDFENLACEVCRHPIPHKILVNGQTTEILTIDRPNPPIPFLLMYRIDNSKIKGASLIFGKTLDEKPTETTIGRAQNNRIEINDISVSRNHATINYTDGRFRLFDKNSKFGTLIEVKEPIGLNQTKTVLQCGRTVLILQLILKEIPTKPLMDSMQIEYDSLSNENEQKIIPKEEPQNDRFHTDNDSIHDEKKEYIQFDTKVEIESCSNIKTKTEEDGDIDINDGEKHISLIEASKKIKKMKRKTID